MSSENLLDAGTYAWIVIIGFFLVFIAVRAIETPTIVGIHLFHLSVLSDAAVISMNMRVLEFRIYCFYF